MIKRIFLIIFIIVLILVIIFSVSRYIRMNQKYLILKKQHDEVISEKKNLKEDIRQLTETKQALETRAASLNKELNCKQDELNKALIEVAQLNRNISILKSEKKDAETKLKRRMGSLQQEILRLELARSRLDARLHSITELEQALKQARKRRRLAKKELVRRLDEIMLRLGNKGYLIKDGEPTAAKSRRELKKEIKVELLPTESMPR